MDELVTILLFLAALVFIPPGIALYGLRKHRIRLDALEKRFDRIDARLATADLQASPANQAAIQPDARRQDSPKPQPDRPAAEFETSEDSSFGEEDAAPSSDARPDDDAWLDYQPPQISLSMKDGGESISGEPDSAPPAPETPSRSASMEQAFGTKWLVWIGGIALALGGIFMVRYSIEAGLVGPGVRIAMGAAFAACLGVVGEFARRRDLTASLAGVPSAYIPGVITAAAILTAFATVYTAYAIYGFLPSLVAFALLAGCAFAALSASFLHGPGLAALGLVASLATPALVGAKEPDPWSLFIYLLIVVGATFFTARLKGWLWLAVSATVGAVLWGLLWFAGSWSSTDVIPMGFYILSLVGLSLFFLPHDIADEEDGKDVETFSFRDLFIGVDWPTTAILMAVTFLAVPLIRVDAYSTPAVFVLAAVTLLLLSSAWRWPNLAPLTVWSSVLFCTVYLVWHFPIIITEPVGPLDDFLGLPKVLPPPVQHFLVIGGLFGGGFAAAGFVNTLRGGLHPFWVGISASTPIVIFAYAYYRATGFQHDVPFGIFALAMSALYIGASDVMLRTGASQLREWRSGIYAASAVVCLALAMTILLEKGWLTISLALICPGLAWIALKRPVAGLRYLAAGMALVVMARLVWDPIIIGSELGKTPILNWLLYGYGVPALAFFSAAWLFRKRVDDIAIQILEAAGILCVVALFGLQIRHALNDGNVYSTSFDLAELAIHSITMLGLAIGLQKVYDKTGRATVRWASAILGMASLAAILAGHLVFENPMLTNEWIGEGRVFNLLILAYAVPALLCVVLYWVSVGRRPEIYVILIGATAFLLLFSYLTLETRALFQGPRLATGLTSDTEWYTYSAVWLGYGAALLAAGIVSGKAALRYASLAIIILTVGKVFLSDMENLSGILRALSFIGLGAVLVGIGFFYQRFVFPSAEPEGEIIKKDTQEV